MEDLLETKLNTKILNKIRTKNVKAAVMGLGYVGMPLLLTMGRHGIKTIGFDTQKAKIDKFLKSEEFLKDLDTKTLNSLIKNKQTTATSDINILKEADVIIICVPTPLTIHQNPKMDYIEDAVNSISRILRKGQLIILESTTFPGTTDEIVIPLLEKTGLKCGEDFFVAYSPEREDPGNKKFKTNTTPKIVGADDENSIRLATEFYDLFIDQTVPVKSSKVAESAKLMENIFRAVNIGLVNELKTVFCEMGIDIWEVIDAAQTKPFGFMPFYPGPGIGGHCIPIDPLYLTFKSSEYKVETRFISLANEINNSMPKYVASGLSEALNDKFAKSLNGANILIIGIAYKKNIDDARESPSSEVIKLLRKRKANISFYDPYVKTTSTEEYKDITRIDILSKQNIAFFDATVILTDHDGIDWDDLVINSNLVIDTRNATKKVKNHLYKIIKL